ncbi:Protein of unknown function (DUF3435) [Teratosphaeria destructans]|uniref:Tyr recombinase domain-containing protein n=1 Tax=Teratosphaeria destructans TaxID=418781 RepID=A0A9W7STW8_9PEZI|nr:Protein of unknown function (DUF3435) [Teratosphaeria destructans]
MRRMCPVAVILALGIADEVFKDIVCPEDLLRLRFQPGQEVIPIRIRPEKKNLPILRRIDRSDNVSVSEIMTADQLCKHLTRLGWRAGYEENLGTYSFRRAFGNQLDRYVTAAQRRRQMGHKNDDTFQFYISQTSDLHTQAIMNGTKQDQDAVDWLRSMRNKRNLSAPKPKGSLLTDSRFWRKNALNSA